MGDSRYWSVITKTKMSLIFYNQVTRCILWYVCFFCSFTETTKQTVFFKWMKAFTKILLCNEKEIISLKPFEKIVSTTVFYQKTSSRPPNWMKSVSEFQQDPRHQLVKTSSESVPYWRQNPENGDSVHQIFKKKFQKNLVPVLNH